MAKLLQCDRCGSQALWQTSGTAFTALITREAGSDKQAAPERHLCGACVKALEQFMRRAKEAAA